MVRHCREPHADALRREKVRSNASDRTLRFYPDSAVREAYEFEPSGRVAGLT
jgi:hypothetical protein